MRPLAALLLLGALVWGVFEERVGGSTGERATLNASQSTSNKRDMGIPSSLLPAPPAIVSPTATPPPESTQVPQAFIIDVQDQRERAVTPYTVWAAIMVAFPESEWSRAALVVWCESRYRPAAVGRAGERGLAQIHPVHIPLIASLGYTWDQMFELEPNLAVARALYDNAGHVWTPWVHCGKQAW